MSVALAERLLGILNDDTPRLTRIKNYILGHHDDPYMPDTADREYKLLAQRAVTNWMPFLIETPVQAMFVDDFRASDVSDRSAFGNRSPAMQHWQHSRLDARQTPIMREAMGYGHSFTVTRMVDGQALTKGLSPLRTAAVFEDPANDDAPVAALTVLMRPDEQDDSALPGTFRMWDDRYEYEGTFYSPERVTISRRVLHGMNECPVTRFAPMVDLEGNTMGVVEPLIPLQNRLNQTMLDLLVTQTFSSFQVRTVTGMAPPLQMKPVYEEDPETGEKEIVDYQPVIGPNGQPVPAPINHNARRFLFAEDKDVQFGTLPGSPLNGFIESVDLTLRHLSALSQTPPMYLLGQVANLSAEALHAAETGFSRKVELLRTAFGESWERVARLAAQLNGDDSGMADEGCEVIWRDMEARSLSQTADALGKLSESLGIPRRGLWRRVPNVTPNELEDWEEMFEQESPDFALANAAHRATAPVDWSLADRPDITA